MERQKIQSFGTGNSVKILGFHKTSPGHPQIRSLMGNLNFRAPLLSDVTFLYVCIYALCTLDWSVYTCLTQLYGGREMYNLLHKEQLHVSALFIGHLQVGK